MPGRVGEPIHINTTIKKRARTAIKNRDHAHGFETARDRGG